MKEIFKTFMSESLYNKYLNDEIVEFDDIYELNRVVDDELRSWFIFNSHISEIHEPGTTFFVRLMTQNDVDRDNDIGTKFLVNISYNENSKFLVNWFTLEQ